MAQSRQLSVILFSDMVGYTSLMGQDEQKAFDLLGKNRKIHRPIVEAFNGRWIKEIGDGIMASFNTVTDAVFAALQIQEACKLTNEYQLRIGIHMGEVIEEDGDLFGDGVNIAARIQAAAEPGSIYISEAVYQNISNKKETRTRYIRAESLKNVKDPVRIFEVLLSDGYKEFQPGDKRKTPVITVSKDSIVVLPFANMSSDPEQEYFSDGITEEIITELSRLRNLLVISRSSAMTLKGTKKKIKEIAEELQVHYVLEGSVRKAGNQLRITAQLIDSKTDSHLWAEKYSGTLDDVFDIQEKVARAIVDALKIELSPQENKQMAARPIQDSKAYDFWIQAMYEFRKFSGNAIEKGILLVKRALDIEGENARLYASLGYLYWAAYDFGLYYNIDTLNLVDQYASQSLLLNPDNAQALFAKGLSCYKRGDMSGFIRHATPAISLGMESEAQSMYAFILCEIGRPDLALPYAEKALESDPLTFLPWWARAATDLFLGKPQEAYHRIRDARNRLAPGEPFAGWWVAQMAAYAGKFEEAYLEFKQVAASDGGMWSDFCSLFKMALDNDKGSVRRHLQETRLKEFAQTDEYYPLFLANALARIGDRDEALKMINQAINWGFCNCIFLSDHNIFLHPLKEDPNFKALIERARHQMNDYHEFLTGK